MHEGAAARRGRLDGVLGAEMLLVALVMAFGGISLPRVALLLPLASMSIWMRGLRWAHLGLRRPPAVWRTVAAAVAAALGILVAVRLVILPLAVWITGVPVDTSAFEAIRGNARLLLAGLALSWTLAAFGEEMVFRGYLMSRIAGVAGGTRAGWAAALVISSACFGWAHGYQGPAGMVATGLIGALLGLLYLGAGRNLWTVIICHGVVDTLTMILIYFGRLEWLFP